MNNKKYYLHNQYQIGIKGDLIEAVQADHPFDQLHAGDFYEVTAAEYNDTVLDWRFENGEWEQ